MPLSEVRGAARLTAWRERRWSRRRGRRHEARSRCEIAVCIVSRRVLHVAAGTFLQAPSRSAEAPSSARLGGVQPLQGSFSAAARPRPSSSGAAARLSSGRRPSSTSTSSPSPPAEPPAPAGAAAAAAPGRSRRSKQLVAARQAKQLEAAIAVGARRAACAHASSMRAQRSLAVQSGGGAPGATPGEGGHVLCERVQPGTRPLNEVACSLPNANRPSSSRGEQSRGEQRWCGPQCGLDQVRFGGDVARAATAGLRGYR